MLKIKDGVNLGTHWIALYVNGENVIYFDRFGVEHVSKDIKKIISNKNILTNVYRIQTDDSITCGYFLIGFIDFIWKGTSLLQCKNLFPPNEYKNNDKIILKHFL